MHSLPTPRGCLLLVTLEKIRLPMESLTKVCATCLKFDEIKRKNREIRKILTGGPAIRREDYRLPGSEIFTYKNI